MILVVDDSADTAEALVRLFRKSGRDAEAVSCGEDLFVALNGIELPQVILLDIAMPGMSGIDCLHKLAADERLREIPVIVYSADVSYATAVEARSAGARDYLVKGTVAWANLLSIIEKHIEP